MRKDISNMEGYLAIIGKDFCSLWRVFSNVEGYQQ